MKAITFSETAEWLDQHELSYLPGNNGADGFLHPPDTGLRLEFAIPPSANREVLLAHGLAKLLPETEVLLWITYGGGADEEMEFFKAWREDHGERRPHPEARSYLFNLSDEHDRWMLTEVMFILMALNWEGFVAQPNGPDIVWLGDEIIDIVVQDRGTLESIQTLINSLCIEPLANG